MATSRQMVITDSVVDRVMQRGISVNDALCEEYSNEIADRLRGTESAFKSMTPLEMVMCDAGIGRDTVVGDIINQSTISTQKAGEWLLPAFMVTRVEEMIKKDDYLPYIVNRTSTTSSRVIKAPILDMTDESNKKNTQPVRIEEGADIPLASVKMGETAISLHKHGRGVEITYEAYSEMRLDMFALVLDMIGKDVANAEMNRAVNVALNGDGNNNAAIKMFDTATANVITADELDKAFVKYWRNTASRYSPTTIVAGEELFLSLRGILYNSDEKQGTATGYTLSTPQLPGNKVNLILSDSLPQVGSKNIALFLNNDISLVKHVLNGSLLREYDKNIRNQTKLGTITEIAGFSKPFPKSVQYIASK